MTTTGKHPSGQGKHVNSAPDAKAVLGEKRSDEAQREEAKLDQAVENTFPASDPVAELPASAPSARIVDSEDAMLDKAIEMTFPASDPIAVANITKVVPVPHLPAATGKPGH